MGKCLTDVQAWQARAFRQYLLMLEVLTSGYLQQLGWNLLGWNLLGWNLLCWNLLDVCTTTHGGQGILFHATGN